MCNKSTAGVEDKKTGCDFVEDGLISRCLGTEHQSLHSLARGFGGLVIDVGIFQIAGLSMNVPAGEPQVDDC